MDSQVRAAIARVTVRQGGEIVSRGTGFLVAPGVVLTALHVTAPDGEVVLEFPDHTTPATRGRVDADLDWSELRCTDAPNVRGLPLGEATAGAEWTAYGWPDAQSLDGMVVHGRVTNPAGTLRQQPALQLFCEEAAAGRGMKLRGLSGGPILVDGCVVGLARFALMTEGRAEAGTLYATPTRAPAAELGLRLRPAAQRAEDADLEVLRDRVRHFWIEGVLEPSLHGHAVEIEMEQLPDAVEHPWEGVVESPKEASQIVARGTRVVDLFEDVQRSLLIVGEPGSGKTTALLELARDLSARGDHVPVVLPLSTWSGGALRDWALAELRSKYQIPEVVGAAWLDAQRIVLLLDGLDEVAAERRAECVEAINAHETLAGYAVTCRVADYDALPVKLRTRGAVCLRPLTPDQIARYVAECGPALAGLAQALQRDEALRELAASPLLLGVMTQAYGDTSAETLAEQHSVPHLFETYIERMLRRPENEFTRERTEHGMRWIARELRRRKRTVFLVEELQPDVVAAWSYRLALVALGGLLLGVLCAMVPLQPALGDEQGLPWIDPDNPEELAWVIAGPLWVLGVTLTARRRAWLPQLAVFGAVWVPIVAAMWLTPFVAPKPQHYFTCLVVAVLAATRDQSHSLVGAIRATESLGFDWRRARRWALWGTAIGGLNTLIGIGLHGWTQAAPYGFLVAGAIVGAILGGPRPHVVKGKTHANEGMRLTALTAGRMALLAVVPVAVAPLALWHEYPQHVLQYTTAALIGASGAFALWFGGLDLVKHAIVRVLVDLPLRLPRFLDHACRLGFLQRVGSGYLFTHRLLQEHFADRRQE